VRRGVVDEAGTRISAGGRCQCRIGFGDSAGRAAAAAGTAGGSGAVGGGDADAGCGVRSGGGPVTT